ncbi:YigZ family protein [Leuconostoc carnosum]|uniref:YigZ family protein n=1 Tax=Leuconostoc carnosum TaxID=1252 RepID=UPI0012385F9C|nr:YigZ family protein [Leuconostoc carnosum]KAA8362031.1 YigZ family protein [Leuconostoc carnosum]KAA8366579.1 YigZ family protein [Leuconostoc carnosum]
MNQYLTIAPQNYTWEQNIKKSRFILNVARITSEEDARLFIERINKAHYKANHNVFAYMLGDNDQIQRYSDNGEPSGTAGVPMLEVLQKNHLHDVVAIVTRYFGGIKLGAGGLIRAYSGTTADGLKSAGFVERLTRLKVTITAPYRHSETLNYWLETNNYPIVETQYDTMVHSVVAVSEDDLSQFKTTLTNHFSGSLTFMVGETIFFEIPVS